MSETFDHSISAAMSRTETLSTLIPSRAAALATRLTFDSLISGTRPPIAFGQK